MHDVDVSILDELKKNQGEVCVSVILSTVINAFDDKEKIQLKLKKTINEVHRILTKKYSVSIADPFTALLKGTFDRLDLDHLPKGIAVYISPGFNKKVSFKLPVKDSILIDQLFETDQLEYQLSKTYQYLVLLLSLNKTRLLKGYGSRLHEVMDDHFPHAFTDEFQVQRASPYSLYNNEESKIAHKRQEDFFRKIDKSLGEYMDNCPLIIMGVKSNVSLFKSLTKYVDQIIGEQNGNYDKSSIHDLEGYLLKIL